MKNTTNKITDKGFDDQPGARQNRCNRLGTIVIIGLNTVSSYRYAKAPSIPGWMMIRDEGKYDIGQWLNRYIQSLLTHYQPKCVLHSADKGSLVVPRSNMISYGTRAFWRFAPLHFNQLPQNISQSPTLATFKSVIKTHLFSLVYC